MPLVIINVWGYDEFLRALRCQMASKMAKPILANIWPRSYTFLAAAPSILCLGRRPKKTLKTGWQPTWLRSAPSCCRWLVVGARNRNYLILILYWWRIGNRFPSWFQFWNQIRFRRWFWNQFQNLNRHRNRNRPSKLNQFRIRIQNRFWNWNQKFQKRDQSQNRHENGSRFQINLDSLWLSIQL